MATGATLREALQGFLGYRELMGSVDWLLAKESDDAVAFDYMIEGGSQRVTAAFFNFATLAALARFYDPQVRIREVTFSGPTFGTSAHRREMLFTDASFDQARNHLVLKSDVLDRPFDCYNRTLAGIQHAAAAKMRDRLRTRESFARACETLLGEWLRDAPEEYSGAQLQQRICGWFEISRWTLQRRLQAEQTSFHNLLVRARMSEAQALLKRTRLPVGEIASMVGYASLSAFSHSFARECGVAPSIFRDVQNV